MGSRLYAEARRWWRCYCGGTAVMEVLLRSLYGATAVMAVPQRPHCGLTQPAVALRKFWTCSKFSPCNREGPRFWQFSAVLRRSMTEPLRNHGDHGGATAVYAVGPTSTAVAPGLRCDGGIKTMIMNAKTVRKIKRKIIQRRRWWRR